MPSRMQRATRAYAFLAKYPSYDRCDLRSSVVDLLADLLHLCESQGIAGDAAFSLAQRHCDNDRDDDASPLTRFTITITGHFVLIRRESDGATVHLQGDVASSFIGHLDQTHETYTDDDLCAEYESVMRVGA